MTEQNREWSVAEVVFGEVPPIPAAQPVKPPTAAEDLRTVLGDWANRHDLDNWLDITLANSAGGDATVTFDGLTFDDDGDIVYREREYRFTSTVTITVEVTGTVTARNEDDAHDEAEDILAQLCVDGVDLSSWAGDIEVENYDVDNYSVDRITN